MTFFILQDLTYERTETFTVSLSELDGTQATVNISAIGTVSIGTNHGGIVGFAEDTLPDREYVVGTAILPVILPKPIDDDFEGEAEYSLTPLPAGLSFNAAARTLSGVPAVPTTMPVTLTYTAVNFKIINGNKRYKATSFQSTSASLTFSVTVTNSGVGSTNGVGSVLHYPNAAAAAAATTPITRTDLVSGGDVYSVVVFGGNVTNMDAKNANAQPAIAYTLGTDAAVQFSIVAHDAAALESGECQAASDTDTSRYTCLYSVATSVAETDPGNYKVSVSAATDMVSDTALEAYDADIGVTIGMRPTVLSVKFYPDKAAAIAETTDTDIEEAAIGSQVYVVVTFSEEMQSILAMGIDTGKPAINFHFQNGQHQDTFESFKIRADDSGEDVCFAKSDPDTSEYKYICHLTTTIRRSFIRIEVEQENTIDLAGHTLEMDYVVPNDFILIAAAQPGGDFNRALCGLYGYRK